MEPKLTIRELMECLDTLEKVSKDISGKIKNWEAYLTGELDVEIKASKEQVREWIQEDAADVSNLLKLRSMIKNTAVRLTTEA